MTDRDKDKSNIKRLWKRVDKDTRIKLMHAYFKKWAIPQLRQENMSGALVELNLPLYETNR